MSKTRSSAFRSLKGGKAAIDTKVAADPISARRRQPSLEDRIFELERRLSDTTHNLIASRNDVTQIAELSQSLMVELAEVHLKLLFVMNQLRVQQKSPVLGADGRSTAIDMSMIAFFQQKREEFLSALHHDIKLKLAECEEQGIEFYPPLIPPPPRPETSRPDPEPKDAAS